MTYGMIMILAAASAGGTTGAAHAQEGELIPAWIKSIFVFYIDGQITDGELIRALEFLIAQDIIDVTAEAAEREAAEAKFEAALVAADRAAERLAERVAAAERAAELRTAAGRAAEAERLAELAAEAERLAERRAGAERAAERLAERGIIPDTYTATLRAYNTALDINRIAEIAYDTAYSISNEAERKYAVALDAADDAWDAAYYNRDRDIALAITRIRDAGEPGNAGFAAFHSFQIAEDKAYDASDHANTVSDTVDDIPDDKDPTHSIRAVEYMKRDAEAWAHSASACADAASTGADFTSIRAAEIADAARAWATVPDAASVYTWPVLAADKYEAAAEAWADAAEAWEDSAEACEDSAEAWEDVR